jgi:GT2 family glycosyltransferase
MTRELRRPADGSPTPTPDATGTSLIICSRDRPELLASVVDSILEGDEVPDELLVVDQSVAPHPTLATFASPRCVFRYLHSATVGLSRSRNIAVAAASHEIIVFTDDDVLVPPTWFGTLVRAFRDAGPRTVVTGRVLAAAPQSEGAFAPSLHPGTERVVHAGRVHEDPLATFNIAFHRSAHAEVGGFDDRLGPGTRFRAAEDNDFGHRLLEAGYRIVFEPEALVYHRSWRDDRAYVALRHGCGRGQGAFFAKHLALDDRYMLRRTIGTLARHLLRLASIAWVEGRATAGAWCPARRRGGRPARPVPRQQAAGEAAWIVGFVTGFLEWVVTMRRLR